MTFYRKTPFARRLIRFSQSDHVLQKRAIKALTTRRRLLRELELDLVVSRSLAAVAAAAADGKPDHQVALSVKLTPRRRRRVKAYGRPALAGRCTALALPSARAPRPFAPPVFPTCFLSSYLSLISAVTAINTFDDNNNKYD